MKIFGSGSVFPHDPADDPKSNRGAGVFVVPITWNDPQDDFTVEKNFSEIRAAIDSGAIVVLQDNFGYFSHLYSDEVEYLLFTGMYTNMNGTMMFNSFGFADDGSVQFYSESASTEKVQSIDKQGA